MYDSYGFIVNKNLETGEFCDYGDSTFFMGLQALNFILYGEFDKAIQLYNKCKSIDFFRHPKVLDPFNSYYRSKNQTSYDILVIWDFLCNRYPALFKEEPLYHYRKSKYFWGKHRNKKMYCSIIGLLILLFSFPTILALWRYFKKRFHKIHIFMLYLAVCFYKIENNYTKFFRNKKLIKSFLYKILYEIFHFFAKNLVYLIEHKLKYKHLFFRFLFYMDTIYQEFSRPEHNAWEWIYQHNLNLEPRSKKPIEFHYEEIDRKKLDLSEQFYYALLKNTFILKLI